MPSTQDNVGVEKTVPGIAVHLVALLFGVFGAGPMYVFSQKEFSKTNARHALNWHLSFLIGVAGLFLVLFLVNSDIVGIVAGFLILVLFALNVIFCLYATLQAVRGSSWTYPLAVELL